MLRWLPATRIVAESAAATSEASSAPPQASEAEHAPTFDFRDLRTSLGKEADRIIPNIVNSYLREGKAHIEVLSKIDGDFDLEHITRIVHNLKSSSAALGLKAFSELCEEHRAGSTQRAKRQSAGAGTHHRRQLRRGSPGG